MSVSASACADADIEPARADGKEAATLRRLIDEAQHSSVRLEGLLLEARSSDAGALQAASRLQERLRVGARLLRAFQAQIEVVEATIAELRAQQQATETAQQALLGRFAALSQRVEGLVAAAERAGGRGSALQVMSHKAARANQRLSRTLAAIDRRSRAARAVLERLDEEVGRG